MRRADAGAAAGRRRDMDRVVAGEPLASSLRAHLGPTNTGKTHRAIGRMLEHPTGMIGLPLRLLAREVYDRVTAEVGEALVALVTGEEKRIPQRPRYWVCTVESMPTDRTVDFLAVDEIQLATHRQRGHTFTERLLHARGRVETWFLGAETMRPLIEELVPTAALERHPRLSQLTYAGASSIGALPPRTAVVAFSLPEVYELAERMRTRHGGTALVLGALSPRTRNAQVAMYQAGEVQYMVATDAIGMGLNMDIDHVAFASLQKFDGKERRPLEPAELAQVAGRAGRYTRDGSFGTLTGISRELPPRVVAALESHRFAPERRLVWRNHALDFGSLERLIASLSERPRSRKLQRIEFAQDYEALLQLAARPDIRARADRPERVELLWEVCRIPDFRKLLVDSHTRLLAEIFEQLAGPRSALDTDWIASRIARLETTEGGIDALMNRIAFTRTWTYVSNHTRWLADARHWQERTRALEDRLSDALHERLTQRFVDSGRPASPHGRRSRPRSRNQAREPTRDRELGRARVDSPFAALLALDALVPDADGARDDDAHHGLAPRELGALVEAGHGAFTLGDDGLLRRAEDELALARLAGGSQLLRPELRVLDDVVSSKGARAQLRRRLNAWVLDAVGELLEPLRRAPAADTSPALRGLLYQLEQGLGCARLEQAKAQLEHLTGADRRELERRGVRIGRRWIFAPRSLRPRRVGHRFALALAHAGLLSPGRARPKAPPTGAVSFVIAKGVDRRVYELAGYPVIGPRAIRVDQLERAREALDAARREPDAELDLRGLTRTLSGWLGTPGAELERVLAAMGYAISKTGVTTRRGRKRRRRRA